MNQALFRTPHFPKDSTLTSMISDRMTAKNDLNQRGRYCRKRLACAVLLHNARRREHSYKLIEEFAIDYFAILWNNLFLHL